MRPMIIALTALLIACDEEEKPVEEEEVIEEEPVDSDGDGVADSDDAFPDDPNESVDTDGDGVGDNGDVFPEDPDETADSDGDGVGDNGDAFPDDPSETADSDGDGLGDNRESELGTDPNSADSDSDGLDDATEVDGDTDPTNEDTDGDGLSDGEEVDTYGTDPVDVDSDDDGATDGAEVADGTDPLDPNSGGADPTLPDSGLWAISNPNVTDDGCNLVSTLSNLGEDLYAVIPEDFLVDNVTANSFDGTISGQTTTCSVVGTTFSCASVTTVETFDVLGDPADLELEIGLEGLVNDPTSMQLSLGATVNSCTGDGCTLVQLFLPIPCSVSLDGDGTLQ